MLIRPCGTRVAHDDGLLFLGGADTVRQDPVPRKVAAADHVAGPRGGNRRCAAGKETVLVAVCHQLGTGFAVGVGVKSI